MNVYMAQGGPCTPSYYELGCLGTQFYPGGKVAKSGDRIHLLLNSTYPIRQGNT